MTTSKKAAPLLTLTDCVSQVAAQLSDAGVAFGQGTTNAYDEAAWLVLWKLGLPLDTPLTEAAETLQLGASDTSVQPLEASQTSERNRHLTPEEQAEIAALIRARIETRKPAAYLTREAWLQGVAFYVDERTIVPRSLIAEVLVEGALDYWLGEDTNRVLDLCTGNGSLAIIAAMTYPDVVVQASDISPEALEVARINVERHGLHSRVTLRECSGLPKSGTHYDLILCNPPYVNAHSMTTLPPEFLAEPRLALDGNAAGNQDGMDFIRRLLKEAPACMSAEAILVLEVGHERAHFDAAFPGLEVYWLATSAGEDQVLLVTREALVAFLNLPLA
jgi:ribosomal protein L3 glutamine methyltransferase